MGKRTKNKNKNKQNNPNPRGITAQTLSDKVGSNPRSGSKPKPVETPPPPVPKPGSIDDVDDAPPTKEYVAEAKLAKLVESLVTQAKDLVRRHQGGEQIKGPADLLDVELGKAHTEAGQLAAAGKKKPAQPKIVNDCNEHMRKLVKMRELLKKIQPDLTTREFVAVFHEKMLVEDPSNPGEYAEAEFDGHDPGAIFEKKKVGGTDSLVAYKPKWTLDPQGEYASFDGENFQPYDEWRRAFVEEAIKNSISNKKINSEPPNPKSLKRYRLEVEVDGDRTITVAEFKAAAKVAAIERYFGGHSAGFVDRIDSGEIYRWVVDDEGNGSWETEEIDSPRLVQRTGRHSPTLSKDELSERLTEGRLPYDTAWAAQAKSSSQFISHEIWLECYRAALAALQKSLADDTIPLRSQGPNDYLYSSYVVTVNHNKPIGKGVKVSSGSGDDDVGSDEFGHSPSMQGGSTKQRAYDTIEDVPNAQLKFSYSTFTVDANGDWQLVQHYPTTQSAGGLSVGNAKIKGDRAGGPPYSKLGDATSGASDIDVSKF